jgi:hypothetical protein
MKFLLDTHIFLWLNDEPTKLSPALHLVSVDVIGSGHKKHNQCPHSNYRILSVYSLMKHQDGFC